MTNNLSDVELLKSKLDEKELVAMSTISALLGLVCTAIVCIAIYSVTWVMNITANNDLLKTFALIMVVTGGIVSFIVGVDCYYKSIKGFKDLIYNNNEDIDPETEAVVRLPVAIICAIGTGGLYLLNNTYPYVVFPICALTVIFTGFFFYIYRAQQITFKKALTYFGLGALTGCSAYGLGLLITISIGLIGLTYTIGILVLECIFTVIFIYILICEWLKGQREKIEREEQWRLNEEAKLKALMDKQTEPPLV